MLSVLSKLSVLSMLIVLSMISPQRTTENSTALYASDLVAELTFFSSLASETPPSRRFGRLSVRVLPCRRPLRAQISIK